MNYENLEGKDGSFENTPGTEQRFYFIPASDMESMADPKYFSEINALGDAAKVGVIGEDHVTKPFKRWFSMKLLLASGNIAGEMIGERGSRSVETVLEGFYIGGTAEIFGIQRIAKEDEYIVLAPHADGTVQQIGRMNKPALITLNTTTGEEGESAKGAEVRIEARDKSGWIYEGAFNLEPRFDFIQGLYLDGVANNMPQVFDASGYFMFGGWFTMENSASDRYLLLSALPDLELAVCINSFSYGEGNTMNVGDVYFKNGFSYHVLGNISATLFNSNHIGFILQGNIAFLYVNGIGVGGDSVVVGDMVVSAWVSLLGEETTGRYKGIVDELFYSPFNGDFNIMSKLYNNRKGKVATEVDSGLEYYFTFNAGVDNDTEVINDGDLGGVVNTHAATFVEWEPDEL